MMENIVKKRQGYTDMHVALAAVSWGRGDRCVCVCSICSSMRGQRESEYYQCIAYMYSILVLAIL